MRWYRNASIRKKVTFSLSMACMAVLLSSAAFAWYDVQMMKENLARQTATLADTLGANSVTSLLFEDSEVAGDILSSTRLEESIQFACTYDKSGRVFARFGDANEPPPAVTLPIPRDGIVHNGDGYNDIIRPIWHNEQQIGALMLRVGTAELNRQLWQLAAIFVVILVFAMSVTFVTASLLHRAVSRPIAHLMDAMHQVSTTPAEWKSRQTTN